MPRKKSETEDPAALPAKIPAVAASSVLLADIAMRSGSRLLRAAIEARMLRGQFGIDEAEEVLSKRGIRHAAAAIALSRFATGSLPGALLVGGGLVAKNLFDRSQRRRRRRKAGAANRDANGDLPAADA